MVSLQCKETVLDETDLNLSSDEIQYLQDLPVDHRIKPFPVNNIKSSDSDDILDSSVNIAEVIDFLNREEKAEKCRHLLRKRYLQLQHFKSTVPLGTAEHTILHQYMNDILSIHDTFTL